MYVLQFTKFVSKSELSQQERGQRIREFGEKMGEESEDESGDESEDTDSDSTSAKRRPARSDVFTLLQRARERVKEENERKKQRKVERRKTKFQRKTFQNSEKTSPVRKAVVTVAEATSNNPNYPIPSTKLYLTSPFVALAPLDVGGPSTVSGSETSDSRNEKNEQSERLESSEVESVDKGIEESEPSEDLRSDLSDRTGSIYDRRSSSVLHQHLLAHSWGTPLDHDLQSETIGRFPGSEVGIEEFRKNFIGI
jgi:hypothetical protein